MSKIKKFEDFVNENVKSESLEINITENESDERSNEEQELSYSVDYTKTINGDTISFDGTLKPYDTGRATEYSFEPNFFTDEYSEEYYDKHWEEVEEEILKEFNK